MRITLAFLLLFITTAAGAQDALHVREVDDYLTCMEAFGVSGVVVIMDRGKIVLEKGYGLADRARNVPMTPDTLFDIGSITKTYTGTAILQLVDAGKLTLDDTLPKFFKDVPEEKRGITIRQLMTHTAGLPLYSGGDFELATREQMVKATLEPKLRFPPGSKWEYCNTCYQLLTVIVEDLGGKPYEKYIHDHLLAPAGIRDTGYVIPDWLGRPTAIAYRGSVVDGSPLEKPWYGDGPSWNLRGAGGFMAPLRDLAKWDRALRALPESIRKRHVEPVIATGRANQQMAYSWFYRETPHGRLVMHSGGNGFFAVNLRRYLDLDLVVVFGTNNSHFDWLPTEGEVTARLLGTSKMAMPPAAKLSSASLLKHAGRYQLPTGEEFELRADRGQLVLDGSPAVLRLLGRHAKALDTPRAREVEALAREVTTAVGKKDFSLLTKNVPPDVEPAGEEKFYAEWMKEREERYGPFVSATPLWTIAAEGEDLHAYVLMRFAHGGEILAFQQRAKGIYLHVPPRPVVPEVYRFVAQSETELVTWNPYIETATTLRVEPEAIVLGGTRAKRVP